MIPAKKLLVVSAFPIALLAAALLAPRTAQADDADAARLRATEIAFAKTMVDRDLDAFGSFLAADVVFFGSEERSNGRDQVVASWSGYFEGDEAPFSWGPEVVAVSADGRVGFTSGPVFDRDGERIGTFNSVWRAQEDGSWKIVFDRGCPCP